MGPRQRGQFRGQPIENHYFRAVLRWRSSRLLVVCICRGSHCSRPHLPLRQCIQLSFECAGSDSQQLVQCLRSAWVWVHRRHSVLHADEKVERDRSSCVQSTIRIKQQPITLCASFLSKRRWRHSLLQLHRAFHPRQIRQTRKICQNQFSLHASLTTRSRICWVTTIMNKVTTLFPLLQTARMLVKPMVTSFCYKALPAQM